MSKIGFIYKIMCEITGEIYIGSTNTAKLSQRLAEHRSDYKHYLKGNKNYRSSFQIIERGNYGIHLLETVNHDTIYELRVRERYYFENCECINKNRPVVLNCEIEDYQKNYQSKYQPDYYKANRKKILEKQQIHDIKNRDSIAIKKREYRKANREKQLEKLEQLKMQEEDILNFK